MGALSRAKRRANDGGDGKEPDYRFTLANERTFLAWIRTALALVAGAVAVLHLVPLRWHGGTQLSVGLALAALAVVITCYAPIRWMRVQRAMQDFSTSVPKIGSLSITRSMTFWTFSLRFQACMKK